MNPVMTMSSSQLKDPPLLISQNYIGGKWGEAGSGMRFNVTGKQTTSSKGIY
jgi:hypothetical protein